VNSNFSKLMRRGMHRHEPAQLADRRYQVCECSAHGALRRVDTLEGGDAHMAILFVIVGTPQGGSAPVAR